MAVDYEKLGELIDGHGGISADDLHALSEAGDNSCACSKEIALLRAENSRLRQALADVELILTGVVGGAEEGKDLLEAEAHGRLDKV